MNKIILLLVFFAFNKILAQTNSTSNNVALSDSIIASYTNPQEPGIAIAVMRNAKVIYKNTKGITDLSNNLTITDSSTFSIASVSKQFTAFLTLITVEEEKLSLQDNISQFLPELENLPYKITIKQLTNHTHGLPNYSDLIQMIGFGPDNPISNDQAVKTMLSIDTANSEPGTQYQYGNSGFILFAEK